MEAALNRSINERDEILNEIDELTNDIFLEADLESLEADLKIIEEKIAILEKLSELSIDNPVTFSFQDYDLKEVIINFIDNVEFPNENYYLIKLDNGTKYITLTRHNLLDARQKIFDALEYTYQELYSESWGTIGGEIIFASELTLIMKDASLKYKLLHGEFFPWYIKPVTKYVSEVFSKLQIFENFNKSMFSENCFIYSLKMHNHENIEHETLISKLKKEVLCSSIEKKDIKKLCDKFNFTVNLHYSDGKHRQQRFGNINANLKYEICLLNDHYFIYIKDTLITSYYMKNRETLGDRYNFNGRKNVDSGIDSFKLVKHLKDSEWLIPIPNKDLLLDETYEVEDKIHPIDIDVESHARKFEFEESNNQGYELIYFDVETYTDHEQKHIPYLCSFTHKYITRTFYGIHCLRDMLNSLDPIGSHFMMYAHNSTYDGSFILQYLLNLKVSEKDNKYVSVKGKYKTSIGNIINVLIKDSLRILPMKLSEFGSAFDLEDCEKECMYYSIYNEDTISHIRKMPRDEIQYYINLENNKTLNQESAADKEKLWWNNISKYQNIDGTYDLLAYSKYYCEQDCKILRAGVEKADKLFGEIHPKLSIHNFFSLPSIAQRYLYYEGCYDDCYEFDGLLSEYFNKFVDGGRCMSRNNEKINVKGKIQDFDAVSLYPSAMHFMEGFVKGLPKKLTNFNKVGENNELDTSDYYFVTVKIKSVGKKRPFSCMNVKNKNKSKEWTNDVVGTIQHLDKIQLSEAEKWHKIDYEILSGYYFNEGFNTTIKTAIESLFNKRLEAKKAKNNGLQLMYKLMMNSSYGKHLQKVVSTEVVYKLKKDFEKYCNLHYNAIISFNFVNDYVRIVRHKKISSMFSSPHMGCQILSYSKLIMNNVINLADDHSIDVFYQDTDSIHLFENDLEKLSIAYRETFGKELVGSKLGQFHSDFVIVDEDQNPIKADNIYSSHLIVLGKKCYIDKLCGMNGDMRVYGNHLRMKGVSYPAFYDACIKNNCQPEDIYNKLYLGEEVEFDLGVNNRVRFSKNKSQQFSTASPIKRKLKF